MLVDAARECGNPNLRAIIFRQQFTQMTDIVDKRMRLYEPLGGNYVGPPSWTWTFPSGAKIRLAYISTDKDIWEYLGPRYSFIGFDESTFHSEYQVRNMLGRLSSTDKTLRLRMRLASNPGGLDSGRPYSVFLLVAPLSGWGRQGNLIGPTPKRSKPSRLISCSRIFSGKGTLEGILAIPVPRAL